MARKAKQVVAPTATTMTPERLAKAMEILRQMEASEGKPAGVSKAQLAVVPTPAATITPTFHRDVLKGIMAGKFNEVSLSSKKHVPYVTLQFKVDGLERKQSLTIWL